MTSGSGFTAVSADPAPDRPVGSGPPGRARRRGWRLAAAACGLALGCTVLGGVAGGLVAINSGQHQLDAGYRLGPLPGTLAGRTPAPVTR
ncbi:MAG: hypothetical protein J2P28_19315, partial [Actinobacteria bacterium]|nr:hypothetical protein [Actinomycetota bacterium]